VAQGSKYRKSGFVGIILVFAMLAGCFGNDVVSDLNTYTDINEAQRDAIAAVEDSFDEMVGIEEPAELFEHIENAIIPHLEALLTGYEDTEAFESEEVQALHDEYIGALTLLLDAQYEYIEFARQAGLMDLTAADYATLSEEELDAIDEHHELLTDQSLEAVDHIESFQHALHLLAAENDHDDFQYEGFDL
jgi:hypothetical protein